MDSIRFIALALATTTACGLVGGVDVGDAAASLDGPDEDTGWYDTRTFEIDGVVTDLGPSASPIDDALHPVWGELEAGVELETEDGARYRVSWRFGDADGESWTQDPDLNLGDAVHLHFDSVQSWGTASGFVLTDAEGLVVALEDGSWGPALDPSAYPVTVESGAVAGSDNDGCGRREQYELVFDDTLALVPGESEVLWVDDEVAVTAWALSNYDWLTIRCTDTSDVDRWALTR